MKTTDRIFDKIRLRFLLLILALAPLSSCGSNDECIAADDFGAYEYSMKTNVYALNPSLMTNPDILKDATKETKDQSEISPGISEKDAYQSSWTKIKVKTNDSGTLRNENKNGFIVKDGSVVTINLLDGAVNLVSKSETLNLIVDDNAKSSGFAGIAVTKTKFEPGALVTITIAGNAQSAENNESADLSSMIAFHVESDNLDGTVASYKDPSAWICNVGSKQFYSSRQDQRNGKYICDFITGVGCDPVGQYDRISDAYYPIFGSGYTISGENKIVREQVIDHEMFDVNSGFAICTSNPNLESRYNANGDGSKMIGWSDSDWPFENALTGTYFDGKSCASLATTHNMSVIAQKIGGIVKYATVSGMSRNDWSSGKNYIIDSAYPNINNPYRSDNSSGRLTTCYQPKFTTINPKQIFLFRSLSNDPKAHTGFHHNRQRIEENLRNGAWKGYFEHCGISPLTVTRDDYNSFKFMASFISRPHVANAIMRAYSEPKWECDGGDNCGYSKINSDAPLPSVEVDEEGDEEDLEMYFIGGSSDFTDVKAFTTDDYCNVTNDASDDYRKTCAGAVQIQTMLRANNFCYSGHRNTKLVNSRYLDFDDDIKEIPERGSVKPECQIKINGDSSKNTYIDMSNSRSWAVYPQVFQKNTEISITSNARISNSGGGFYDIRDKELQELNLGTMPSSAFYTQLYGQFSPLDSTPDIVGSSAKLSKYGWCYERSPCKVNSRGCSSYSYIGSEDDEKKADSDGKLAFHVWSYAEYDNDSYNNHSKFKNLRCNSIDTDVLNSNLETKEYKSYGSNEFLYHDTMVKKTCGYDGFNKGEKTKPEYRAIYCNSQAKWMPNGVPRGPGTISISTSNPLYCSGGGISSSLSGPQFIANDSTPSVSSHNLYCHPNKTRECGIAMGFRTFKGEIHRCIKGYKLICSDKRYNGDQCGIWPKPSAQDLAEDSSGTYLRTLGVCVRRVTGVSGTESKTMQYLMRYNNIEDAASTNNGTSAFGGSSYNPSLKNLTQYDEFDPSSPDRNQSVSVAGNSHQTTELVDIGNCGICVHDKKALANGLVTKESLDRSANSAKECENGWITSYTVDGDNRSLITINDVDNDTYKLTGFPNGDTINVSYIFQPVRVMSVCQDSISDAKYYSENLTEKPQSEALFKSMAMIRSDDLEVRNNSVSGRITANSGIIQIPQSLGKSRIYAYFAGEGGVTQNSDAGKHGFQRFKEGSNAAITFSSGSYSSDGNGLFFYIQPLDSHGKPDPDFHPHKQFEHKRDFDEKRRNNDGSILSFNLYKNSSGDKATFNINKTGVLWSIVFDQKPTSTDQYDRDGKYLIFNGLEDMDPYSDEYENQAVALDGSNLLGYNSGVYVVQAKRPIDSSSNIVSELFDDGVSAGNSLLEKFQAMIYGKVDQNSKQCVTYTKVQSGFHGTPYQEPQNVQIPGGSSVGDDTGCGTYTVNNTQVTANASDIEIKGDTVPSVPTGKYRYFCRYIDSSKGSTSCTYSGSAKSGTLSSDNKRKCNSTKVSLGTTGVYDQNNTSFFKPYLLEVHNSFVNQSRPIYTSSDTGCTLYADPRADVDSAWTHWEECFFPDKIKRTRIKQAVIDPDNFVRLWDRAITPDLIMPQTSSRIQTLPDLYTAFDLCNGDECEVGDGGKAVRSSINVKLPAPFLMKDGMNLEMCHNVPNVSDILVGTRYDRDDGDHHTVTNNGDDDRPGQDDDQTNELYQGSYELSYRIQTVLDKSTNRNRQCSDQVLSLSGGALGLTSIDAMSGKADDDFDAGIIPKEWCTNSSCTDYLQIVKDKMYVSSFYSCGLIKCDSSYGNCQLNACSSGDLYCDPLKNSVAILDNPDLPEKYGRCDPKVGTTKKCYIYQLNSNIESTSNIYKCMYGPTGSTVSENSVTLQCWVQKKSSAGVDVFKLVNPDIYNVDDYANNTYLESPKPFKEFSSCQANSKGEMTCNMTDRKYSVISNNNKSLISEVTKSVKAKTEDLSSGEDIKGGVTTRVYVDNAQGIDSSKCDPKSISIDRAQCTLISKVDGYICQAGGESVSVSEKEYDAGVKKTISCKLYVDCQDPSYVGPGEANSTSQQTQQSPKPGADAGDTETTTKCKYSKRLFKTGFIYQMFSTITSSVAYQATFYLLVVLWVMSYGYKMIHSEVQFTTKVFFDQAVRFGIAIGLASPQGWPIYETYVVSMVMRASEGFNNLAIASVTGGAESATLGLIFSPVSEVFNILLSSNFWLKLIAAAFSLPYLTGVLISMLMLGAVLNIMTMLFTAVTQYMSSVILLGLYLSLGPLVALGYMFDNYKKHFESWMKEIVSCIAEQFFLILSLSIASQIVTYLLKPLIYRKICYEPVFSIPLGDIIRIITGGFIDNIQFDIPLLSFWRYEGSSEVGNMIIMLKGVSTDAAVSASGAPSFAVIFILMIVPAAVSKIIEIMNQFAGNFGGSKRTNIVGDMLSKGVSMVNSGIKTGLGVVESVTGRKGIVKGYEGAKKIASAAYGGVTSMDAGAIAKMGISKAGGAILSSTQKSVAKQRAIANKLDSKEGKTMIAKGQQSIATRKEYKKAFAEEMKYEQKIYKQNKDFRDAKVKNGHMTQKDADDEEKQAKIDIRQNAVMKAARAARSKNKTRGVLTAFNDTSGMKKEMEKEGNLKLQNNTNSIDYIRDALGNNIDKDFSDTDIDGMIIEYDKKDTDKTKAEKRKFIRSKIDKIRTEAKEHAGDLDAQIYDISGGWTEYNKGDGGGNAR